MEKDKKGKEKNETAMTVQETTGYLAKPLSQVLNDDQKALIKRCFAKNATDDELDLYYNFCEKAGVDPLRGQSHFIKYKPTDKPIMMIGIDGFQARAISDPRYIGMAANAVYENDEFKMNPVTGDIFHSFGIKDRGKLVGAYALLKRTGLDTAVIWVDFKEYNTGYNVWKDKPEVMIVKVAKASLLRREYPDNFSNVYTPEEFGAEITDKGDFISHAKDVTHTIQPKVDKPKKIESVEDVRMCANKCGNVVPAENKTGVCALCLGKLDTGDGAVQDAEFTEEPVEDEPDDPDDMVRDIPDDLVDDTMTPRVALKKIMEYAFMQELGDVVRPVICEHYEPWTTGDHYAFNIPEPAIIKIVKGLTGIKLKRAEKDKKCFGCKCKITEPEAEEQQNADGKPLCHSCDKTFKAAQESEE